MKKSIQTPNKQLLRTLQTKVHCKQAGFSYMTIYTTSTTAFEMYRSGTSVLAISAFSGEDNSVFTWVGNSVLDNSAADNIFSEGSESSTSMAYFKSSS